MDWTAASFLGSLCQKSLVDSPDVVFICQVQWTFEGLLACCSIIFSPRFSAIVWRLCTLYALLRRSYSSTPYYYSNSPPSQYLCFCALSALSETCPVYYVFSSVKRAIPAVLVTPLYTRIRHHIILTHVSRAVSVVMDAHCFRCLVTLLATSGHSVYRDSGTVCIDESIVCVNSLRLHDVVALLPQPLHADNTNCGCSACVRL